MADLSPYLQAALAGHAEAMSRVIGMAPRIEAAVDEIVGCIAAGGTIFFCGNGGSAADAQHLAAEFVGRFARERSAWPAQALHANTSVLTAIGNDYGFERVYARQIEAFGRPGDVLVGLSTSGGSSNVVAAIEAAHAAGMKVVTLTGRDGGEVGRRSDIDINIGVDDTPRVQEAHIFIGHVICGSAEERLCERR